MFLFAEVEHNQLFAMFENNVINWVLLVAFFWWVMAKNLPPVFQARDESINATLAAAQKARLDAEALLEKQKAAVANAEKEAEQIIVEAKTIAKEMQANLEAQTKKDIAEMLVKFENAVAGERQLLVNELRQASVKAAIELTRGQLASQTSAEVKANLLNQFMEQLETLNTKSLVSSGSLESVSK
ncbi:MAG: ATP synthase F0 subunit B [Candidatus Obscuribacterales bacterium]|jgi:F-type H+-transporting ATPase subunit b